MKSFASLRLCENRFRAKAQSTRTFHLGQIYFGMIDFQTDILRTRLLAIAVFVMVAGIFSVSATRPLPPAVLTTTAAQNQNPLTERAYQDREILYELQSPESHAFRITHDYTVRKVGEKYYFNVVRAGSHVSDPESFDLDTGARLKCEIVNGKQATERKLPITDTIKDDSEIVVTHLTRALEPGTTNRIRLMETYADPKSYYLDSDELVWDRTFGRLRNTVVLPAGWYLKGLASPATIQTLPDGRVSIFVVNPRNDDIRVYLRARRRM